MGKARPSAKVPTSEIALRLAAIMHRQKTTPWNEKKEIGPFRKLKKDINDEDLSLIERYYRLQWPPRTGVNHLRHDLATLINNWAGEVDRARIWNDAHKPKPAPRKIIPLPAMPETKLSEAERAQFALDYEKLMGRKPNI